MTIRYRIEFWIFRTLSWIVSVLPERAALGLCSVLGWFVGVVLRVRRVDTDWHLQIAFPERDSAWRRRAARGSYIHLAREAAMTIRLFRMHEEEILRRTEVVGLKIPVGDFGHNSLYFSTGSGSVTDDHFRIVASKLLFEIACAVFNDDIAGSFLSVHWKQGSEFQRRPRVL